MAFLKNLPGLFLVFSLAFLLSSCASSDRMMRVSPFSSEVTQTSVKRTSDASAKTSQSLAQINQPSDTGPQIDRDGSRINTWPILYKINDKTSVMWPMIDSDPKGFAVRPFYNQEGKEYSIMFPLSAWNPEKGDGWIFSWYWNKGVHGVFPFFHARGSYHYLFPTFWNENYFCSPATLTYVSRNFNMAGPVYWDASSENLNCGFFPLIFVSDGLYAFGPAWIDSGIKPEDKTAFGFFPFAKFAENKNYIFPFFSLYHKTLFSSNSKTKKQDEHYYTSLYLFPYYGYYENNSPIKPSEWKSINWFLLWFASADQDKNSNALIPFYFYKNNAEERSFVSMLGGTATNKKTDELSMLSIMWMMCFYSNDENSKLLSIMFPFSFHGYDKKNKVSTNFIFPYYNKSSENESCTIVPPLFIYDCNKKEKSLYSLLGASNTDKETGELSMLNVMGFLYIYDNDKTSKTMSVLFPLSYYNFNKENKASTIFIFPYYSKVTDTESFSFAPPLYLHTDNKDEESLYTILGAGSRDKKSGELSMINALGIFYIYENSDSAKIRSVLFPFTYYKNNKKSNIETTFIFPYFREETAKGSSSALFPFYYSDEDKQNKNIISLLGRVNINKTNDELKSLNALWFLSTYDKTDTSQTLSILFPLSYCNHDKKDNSETTFIFPYYNYSNDKKSFTIALPAFIADSDEKEKSFYSLIASSSIDKKTDDLSMFNVMGFLYIYDKTPASKTMSVLFPFSYYNDDKANKEETTFIFPYLHKNTKNKMISTVLPLYYYYAEKKPATTNLILPALLSNYEIMQGNSECNILFPFGHTESNEYKTGFSFWPLFAYQDREHGLFCFEYNKSLTEFDFCSYLKNKAISYYKSNPATLPVFPDNSIARLLPQKENICKNQNESFKLGMLITGYNYREYPIYLLQNSMLYSSSFDVFPFTSSYEIHKKLNTAGKKIQNDLNSIENDISKYEESLKKEKYSDNDKTLCLEKKENIIATLKKYGCFKGESNDELAEGLYWMDKIFTTEESKRDLNFLKLFEYQYSFDKEKKEGHWIYANNLFLWMYSDSNIFASHHYCYEKNDDIISKANGIAQKKLNKPVYTHYNLFLFCNALSEYSRETKVLPDFDYCRYEENFNLLFFYISNSSTLKRIKTETVEERNDIEKLKKSIEKLYDIKKKNAEKKSEDKNSGNIAKTTAEINKILKKYDCYRGETEDKTAEGIVTLDAKFSEEANNSYAIIPGLFYNKNAEGKGYGNIMLFFSRWNSDDSKKQSMVNVMEYFFRYQHENGNSYRDMFPFMSLDNGPEMFRISFLWRFIGYKKEKEERTWYLFFVAL